MTQSKRRLGLLVALGFAVVALAQGAANALPANPPKIGIVCQDGPTFDLVATDGTIQTPDGNTVYMWSYADGSGQFQYPGPVLCVNQDDTVTINLTNNLPDPTSIVFPGQDAQVNSTGGSAGLFTQEAASNGGTVSYTFTASNPGTYLYESGSDPAKQVEMGLYGALVVYPKIDSTVHRDWAYDSNTQFDPAREYMLLLAEIDPDLHHAVEAGSPTYDFTKKHDRYFTINGRSFPDTVQDNDSALLPTQPYGALVRTRPTNDALGDSTQPALIRMLNAGSDNHPFHPHGNHTTEIAQDGRLVPRTEHFGESIGSGQTIDYLLRWDDVDQWNPVTKSFDSLNVAPPNYRELTFKDGDTWYSGSPYLGYKGTLPTGTVSQNVCGEWYFPFHSHALNEFTNFDEGFGGMGTLLRVDPPGGCSVAPGASTILTGSLNGGAVSDLAFIDSNYYRINSALLSGTTRTDWYGQFSGVPAGATNLKVTYVGNNTPPLAPVSQDFNGGAPGNLAATGATGTSLPTGWVLSEAGGGNNGSYGVNNGSSATGNTYSYGSTGSTDRAFGTLRGTGGGSTVSTIGAVLFTNNSNVAVSSPLTIGYTGELWRYGAGSGTPDRLDFAYSTNATSLTNGTWTDVNALDFTSPGSGAAGSRDGNAAANRTAINATIASVTVPAGATLRIRWTDFNRTGTDDGLAVDGFSLSVPGVTAATTLYAWNWSSSAWTPIPGTTPVGGPPDTTINGTVPASPPSSWADYVSTGGLVRVRVLSIDGTATFVTRANFLRLMYDGP